MFITANSSAVSATGGGTRDAAGDPAAAAEHSTHWESAPTRKGATVPLKRSRARPFSWSTTSATS